MLKTPNTPSFLGLLIIYHYETMWYFRFPFEFPQMKQTANLIYFFSHLAGKKEVRHQVTRMILPTKASNFPLCHPIFTPP